MMNSDMEYMEAVKQAGANLAEVRARGEDALGESWEDIRKELLSPEERAASNVRVAILLKPDPRRAARPGF